MKLLVLLFRKFKFAVTAALLASAASGVSAAALIALISQRLAGAARWPVPFIAAFSSLVLATILLELLAKTLLNNLTSQTNHALRMQLARQVIELPLARVEQLGTARIHAALTDDVHRITQSMNGFPTLGIAAATAAGCLAYLAWLSPFALLILGLLVCPMLLGHRLIQRRARRLGRLAQETRDKLFHHLLALIDGIKELQLHLPRRQAFRRTLLQPAAAALRDQRNAAHLWLQLAGTWSQSVYFLFILAVMALASRAALPVEVLSGYALLVLYLKSSLNTILAALPQWTEANLALQHLEAAGFSFAVDEPVEPTPPAAALPPFTEIVLRNVVYSYQQTGQPQAGERDFSLGPLDLTLRAGELIFVIGGNGGGKTTLLKLLTGLYAPESGVISWNGAPVTDANRAAYRQNFSAVFAEPFLFDQLLGLPDGRLDERSRDYLARLQLDHKVSVTDGRFSTTDLSHGQRKRLALLTAYLEDRPVYLFDEWAASQDPEFRAVFYRRLLPELKARGKLVVAITHDDQYFDAADRLLKLDFGQLAAMEDARHDSAIVMAQ